MKNLAQSKQPSLSGLLLLSLLMGSVVVLVHCERSSLRRVRAPSFGNPAWSPDGKWLAFDRGTHVYKIRFTGECFDESSIVQLTTQGPGASLTGVLMAST
ncbi:MAG: hypothetical protein ACE5IR_23440 [bacterium]